MCQKPCVFDFLVLFAGGAQNQDTESVRVFALDEGEFRGSSNHEESA